MSKTVLITGGSSGIGKSIGEYLTQKGYLVYGTSRFPEKYKNSKFPIIKLDVTNPNSILDCVKELLDKVTKIDVLINNAKCPCHRKRRCLFVGLLLFCRTY